jgi:hypothetical protein
MDRFTYHPWLFDVLAGASWSIPTYAIRRPVVDGRLLHYTLIRRRISRSTSTICKEIRVIIQTASYAIRLESYRTVS